MPDFEIRYFDSKGDLTFVRITKLDSLAEAELHAHQHQGKNARFEIRQLGDGNAEA